MQYTNAVQKLMAGEPPMTSFSGNFEDVILARVFDGQENGFYVDIGAHHPINGSNTHHFYMQGWRGINIEPAKSFSCFPQQRAKDINLNIAISNSDGRVEFEECDALLAISQLSESDSSARTLEHLDRDKIVVETRTMKSVLDEYLVQGQAIDFISIDVEGHEKQVLESNDWKVYRPKVFCIEATLPFTNIPCHHDWDNILTENNYHFAYFDGVNRFYVATEAKHLLNRFHAPLNVLDHFQSNLTAQLRHQNALLKDFYETVNGHSFDSRKTFPTTLRLPARCASWVARVINQFRLHRSE